MSKKITSFHSFALDLRFSSNFPRFCYGWQVYSCNWFHGLLLSVGVSLTGLTGFAGLSGKGFMNSAPTMARHLLHTGSRPDAMPSQLNLCIMTGELQWQHFELSLAALYRHAMVMNAGSTTKRSIGIRGHPSKYLTAMYCKTANNTNQTTMAICAKTK